MTALIDTHCHLYLQDFSADLPAVLERAGNCQIVAMVVAGIDAKTSEQAVQLAEQYNEIYVAVGIHPNSQVVDIDQELSRIETLVTHPKVVAIGEIGLDYYRKFVPAAEQNYRLQCQLDLAMKVKLPVIIHNRNAIEDLVPLVSRWAEIGRMNSRSDLLPYGVFHSFSEDEQWAQKIHNMGFLIGVSGVITFPNARKIKEVVRSVPLSSLLLETDAPYLSPHPFRGKRNEPSYITYTLKEIASILGISHEVIAKTTTQNAQTLFGID
ncbi:MAG: TatD family hydrolase [Anaerolineales bacterium]|nr:TatD family hydrolase [Anaerolineales bacterium]